MKFLEYLNLNYMFIQILNLELQFDKLFEKMFIEQLNSLQQFLKANKMNNTLQKLRQQLAVNIPMRPSSQLIQIFMPKQQPQKIKSQSKTQQKSKKKPQLLVEGLLGKIAYSSKILDDQLINQRIAKLLQNKIFIKSVGKMFPQAVPRLKELQGQERNYTDELDNTLGMNTQGDGPSDIYPLQQDISIVSHPSFVLQQLQKRQSIADQYTDDNDLGYNQSDFTQDQLMDGCARLTIKYGYPDSAVKKGSRKSSNPPKKNTQKFSPEIVFPNSQDKTYPLEYNGSIYDVMHIKMIYNRQKIGYENSKQIDLKVGDLLMGRYQILGVLGSGVFARVVKVKDILVNKNELTCFKIVSNNKDFLDQALDQIKLLRLIRANCDPDSHYLLNFKNVYYYKEHLLIQTELLKDNLFAAYRKNPSFFSISTIKIIAKQILTALATIHSLNIIHSDLKPQNILIKSYSPVEIKVVDFGNSCFIHDSLGSYVQSRSYRAPEVILGVGYDYKIDIWSVGCIIAELWTKNVLFYNLHIPGMLARMQSILGPWPQWMLQVGSQVSNYFSKQNLIFFQEDGYYHILMPKKTTLKNRIRADDIQFLNFMTYLLQVDPDIRPTAQQALNHPFLN